MTHRYTGQTVLITGAGRGFGALAATRFAAEGAHLVLNDVDADNLAATATACTQMGAQVATAAGDVGDEALHQKLVGLAMDKFGRLDRALNNAGIAHPILRLADISSQQAADVIRIDLLGIFFALKHQLPIMAKQGAGAVLNVASVAGLVGAPMMSVYSAAKHGVIGLTKSAAGEYASKGVRINAICPSFADTQMVQPFFSESKHGPEAALARLTATVPLRRMATPDEIVEAILWMLSPANSFMTGHSLAVDGGLSAL